MISNSRPDGAPRRPRPTRPPITVDRKNPALRRTDTFTRIAREKPRLPRLKMFIFAGALLLLTAFAIDWTWKFSGMEAMGPTTVKGPPAAIAGRPGHRYTDPQGRFAMTVPADSIQRMGEAAYPDDVSFRTPEGITIRVQINRLELPSFGALLAEVRKIEEQYNIETQIKVVEFKGRRAIERNTYLMQVHLLVLDIMDGEFDHHLQVSCPRGQFEQHEPMMRALLNAYEPMIAPPPALAGPPPAEPAPETPPAAEPAPVAPPADVSPAETSPVP